MSLKRKHVFAVATLLLLLVPALAACGNTAATTTQKQVKVGLVTDIGGLNDRGFNHLAYVGLEQAVKDYGIKGDVLQSKSGDDYVPNLTHFATSGYDLVIAVGFLMQQAVGTVSGNFPNVHFAIIDGYGTDANFNDLKHPNVESLIFKEQDAGALVGVIAGMMEKTELLRRKTNTISAVGGHQHSASEPLHRGLPVGSEDGRSFRQGADWVLE